MKLTKTSKIGILVIVCLTLLIWGINFLKGRDIFRTEKVFYARYKNVGGLTATTLVTLNGLKVGYVREIYFAEDLSGDLIVKIALHNNFPLPKGTSAEIASSDLLGSKVVKLNLGKSDMLLYANDTLATKMEADIMQQVNEQIAPIKAKAERMIENFDSIVTAVSKILSSDSQHNISESIRQIKLTMTNLENISGNLNEVVTDQKNNLSSTISNMSEVTGNLKTNSAKLGHIMDNFSSFSDSITKMEIKGTIEHLNGSVANLQTILSKIDTANGTLGLLVNDPRLYQNLNQTSESLNRLLVDFRLNPKKYIRFSAIDLGKEVYVSVPTGKQFADNITFRIQIYVSENPISLTSPMFQGIEEISEIKTGNRYYYVSQQELSYDKIIMDLNKFQRAFPEAFLKCYKNGKEISLKKAIKTNQK